MSLGLRARNERRGKAAPKARPGGEREVIRERFEGRTVVITGAGSGIGLAAARRFSADGAHVVAVDIDDAVGEKAAAETGGLFVHADVTVPEPT